MVAVDQRTAQHAAKLVEVKYKGLEPVIITLEVKESSTLFVFLRQGLDTLKSYVLLDFLHA